MTDTALTRLRADIAANRPWVEGWRIAADLVQIPDHEKRRAGRWFDECDALDIATARALEWLGSKTGSAVHIQDTGNGYVVWDGVAVPAIPDRVVVDWVVSTYSVMAPTLYEALAAACDAVKEHAHD